MNYVTSKHPFITLIILFLLTAMFSTLVAESADDIRSIEVSRIETSDFPTINLYARITDELNKPITNVSSQDIEIFEDGETNQNASVIVEQIVEDTLIHIVIDNGQTQANNPALWQDAVDTTQQILDDLIVSETDAVSLSIVSPDGTRRVADTERNIQAVGETLANTASYNGSTYLRTLPKLSAIVSEFGGTAADVPKHLILITSGLEGGDTDQIEQIVTLAQLNDIQIHVVVARNGRDIPNQYRIPVGPLSAETGGTYTLSTSLEPLVTAISSMRQFYMLIYTSAVQESGIHEVVIQDIESKTTSESNTFTIDVEKPSLEWVTVPTDQIMTYDETQSTLPFEAVVQFPDGKARQIVAAELFLGDIVDTQTDTPWLTNSRNELSIEQNNITFSLDLASLPSKTGLNRFDLLLVARDQIGFEAQLRHFVLIQYDTVVSQAPVTTTSISTAEPVTTSVTLEANGVLTEPVESTSDVEQNTAAPTNSEEPDSDSGGLFRSFRSVLRILTLGGTAAATYFIYLERKTVIPKATQRIHKSSRHVTMMIMGGRRVLQPHAFLQVINGDDTRIASGENIELFRQDELVLGREDADVAFHVGLNHSVLSRKHAIIKFDSTSNVKSFFIVDANSTNGTYVGRTSDNDVLLEGRVRPGQKRILEDGEYIALAPPQRGGIVLKFNISDDHKADINASVHL